MDHKMYFIAPESSIEVRAKRIKIKIENFLPTFILQTFNFLGGQDAKFFMRSVK